MKKDREIFLCSIFFVLGFSIIFSILGILLQTLLSSISFEVQKWLSRIGGVIIIIFGLLLLQMIKPAFLLKEHKFKVTRRFKSRYLTSFIFGAAFAVGWTPCVGPVLGAVLTLAATQPSYAFILLFSYTVGLGLPFLLVGFAANQAKRWIKKYNKWVVYANYGFGVILIAIGALMFSQQLDMFVTFPFLATLSSSIQSQSVGIGISFLAGIISFLSPCILPIIPGFLAYLASLSLKEKKL